MGNLFFIQPLNQMMATMEQACSGYLTVRVKETGTGPEFNQLGTSFNAMLSDFFSLLSELNQTSSVLLESSRGMTNVAQQQLHAVEKTDQAVRVDVFFCSANHGSMGRTMKMVAKAGLPGASPP